MNRIRRWLPRELFESMLMILSILIALAVNDWKEDRARIARAGEARRLFRQEIDSNAALLRSDPYLVHHKRLQTEYRALAEAGSDQPGNLFETGVHPTPLRDAAWRSFSGGSTIADFAPADVVLLSDIYRAQENLEKLNTNFLAQVSAPRSDRETPAYKRDFTRSISLYLTDVVACENWLVQNYERARAQLR